MKKRRVGIVGYGSLGVYLAKAILEDEETKRTLELAFIWNRSPDRVTSDSSLPPGLFLQNLEDFPAKNADLIVEVCHPNIVAEFGAKFLKHADLMVGSPTALA